jgi:hypothetical protein
MPTTTRRRQQLDFASRRSFPLTHLPAGEPVDPPEPHALFAGHVLEAEERCNSVTAKPFWWALVQTIGGTFDVVIDPDLLPTPPHSGNVMSGWFWLSGCLRVDARPKSSWRHRLIGR